MSLTEFIASQRAELGVPHATACRALGLSQAWFYKWRDGDVSLRRARRQALAAQVALVFTRHRRRYGSPRITAELREAGWRVSENTVAALMREQHLVARRRRHRSLTRRDKNARKAPDLLQRDFTPPDEPDVRWCGDLTDIPCEEGKFYLASVLDLHSRRCVGFAMSDHHDAELARAALCTAIAVRGGEVTGVVFHTDQGGEYTGALFARALHQRRDHPIHGTHRIGPRQRRLGKLPLHDRVRAARRARPVRHPGAGPPSRRRLPRVLQPRSAAFDLRHAGAGGLRTRPQAAGGMNARARPQATRPPRRPPGPPARGAGRRGSLTR